MNIEGWTIGAIALGLSFILGFIKTVRDLKKMIAESIGDVVKAEIKPLNEKVDRIEEKIDSVDLEATKNFLVARFEEISRGREIDETMRQRIYEMMNHYEKLGGNSYIHARFEQLKKENKL